MHFCNELGHLGFFYSFNNSSLGLFHISTFAALAASEVFFVSLFVLFLNFQTFSAKKEKLLVLRAAPGNHRLL